MRSLKIAVADDDAGVRRLLEVWLSKLGHEVTAVDGGRPLVELCRGGTFDLVISDVEMPDGDGLEAAETIRWECGLPVLLASGGWTHQRLARARQLGAVCLDKPFLPLVLVAHLSVASDHAGRRECHLTS